MATRRIVYHREEEANGAIVIKVKVFFGKYGTYAALSRWIQLITPCFGTLQSQICLRHRLGDGGLHERVIDSNDEDITGILQLRMVDISRNMRVTAPRACREISSRDTYVLRTVTDWSDTDSIIRGCTMHWITY